MKLLHASIFTLFCTSVQASTVNSHLTDNYLQNLNESNSLSINQNDTSGYFTKHGISQVYSDNPYLYTPSFTTGILDNGYYNNHEDMHSFLNILTTTNEDHGTGLLSLSFGSKLDNNLGTLGIVNTYTDLQSSSNFRDNLDQFDTIELNRIISSSYVLYPNTSIHGNEVGSIYNSIEELSHINEFADLREEIKNNPNNLYIFGAGNSGTLAKWNNGAIHYEIIKNEDGNPEINPDELDNVIVVGAMGYDNILHYYSDFGESVDVATISGIYAAKEVVDGISTYYETSNGVDYGIRQTPNDKNNGDFHGTSAAQPITAGMAALLLSMDPSLTGAELKKLLLHDQLTDTVTSRYTGFLEKCGTNDCNPKVMDTIPTENNHLTNTDDKTTFSIPVINLFNSYDALKTILGNHANSDALLLNTKSATIDSNLSCKTLWEDNIVDRTVSIMSNDNEDELSEYSAYQYDNKCLFFRGNSFIIEYDSTTELAQSLYYGDDNYESYALFRKFTENLASAKSNDIWRNGYEVSLNANGFVGCADIDNCIDNVISTTSHCENLFEALTGTGSSTMNSTVSVPDDNICLFEEDTLETQLFYYADTGAIVFEEQVVEIPAIGNFYLQTPVLSSYTVEQGTSVSAYIEQWYEGDILDSELSSVRVGYYLSDDETWSDDDLHLEYDRSSLGSDDPVHNEDQSLDIPLTTNPGNYYILFVSDYQKNFVETNENDNVKASPITITEQINNDLYITDTSITAQSGTSISVSSRYYYSGNQTSSELGTAYLGYYLSTDRYLSSDDIILESNSSSIGTNDSYDSESETMDLPSDLNSGTYYILFVADYLNIISETNENNNVAYVSFEHTGTLQIPVNDIYIEDAKVIKYADGRYKVSLKQKYQGDISNANLANPDIAYVFSEDETFQSNQDITLGSDYSTIGSDDTSDTESLYFSIPSSVKSSGDYYVMIVVDYKGEIAEINENNNIVYVQFRVDL